MEVLGDFSRHITWASFVIRLQIETLLALTFVWTIFVETFLFTSTIIYSTFVNVCKNNMKFISEVDDLTVIRGHRKRSRVFFHSRLFDVRFDRFNARAKNLLKLEMNFRLLWVQNTLKYRIGWCMGHIHVIIAQMMTKHGIFCSIWLEVFDSFFLFFRYRDDRENQRNKYIYKYKHGVSFVLIIWDWMTHLHISSYLVSVWCLCGIGTDMNQVCLRIFHCNHHYSTCIHPHLLEVTHLRYHVI